MCLGEKAVKAFEFLPLGCNCLYEVVLALQR